MLLRDLACAALGWALAALVWFAAGRLQRSLLSDDFGADGLPRGLAILLAITSTLIAARALWENRGQSPFSAGQKMGTVPGFRLHAKAMGIVALGFGYVLLAPWLGYVPAAFLVIAATAIYYGARLSPTLVAVSLAGAVFLWWMFARLLSVSMPAGIWSKLLG